MYDANLIVRAAAAGDVDADETSAALYIGGPAPLGHSFWARVPSAEAATTIDISLTASATAAGTYTEFARLDQITTAMITAKKFYHQLPFFMPPGKPYLKVLFDVAGTIATTGFGAVEAGVGVVEGPDINNINYVLENTTRPTPP